MFYYFNDRDNNFIDQFQSKNGFDARLWELYLLTWLREEGFNVVNESAVPDFLVEKLGARVSIEAVTVSRKQADFGNLPPKHSIEELEEKLGNETPLMFGSSLYSKLCHTYKNSRYWDLDSTLGLPFCIAIADFQEDMAMTWSHPAMESILYGIEQEIREEEGDRVLYTINGKTFIKESSGKKIEITPLFMDDAFENISAVIFSACGTLSKFNRIGRMCGLGKTNTTMIALKTLYNHDENAIICDSSIEEVNENYTEKWAEGINIFHNPKAKHPLDPNLFPNAAHHFYRDGMLYSKIPDVAPYSITTYNVKNLAMDIPKIITKFSAAFDEYARQWNMRM